MRTHKRQEMVTQNWFETLTKAAAIWWESKKQKSYDRNYVFPMIEPLESRLLFSASFVSDHLKIHLADSAIINEISNPSTSISYLAYNQTFGTVKYNGTSYNTSSCTTEGGEIINPSGITLKFGANDVVSMHLNIEYHDDYFVFTVDSVSQPITELYFKFPTNFTDITNPTTGIYADESDDYALFSRVLTPSLGETTGAVGNPGYFQIFTQPYASTVGSSFAIGSSAYGENGGEAISTLKDVITSELPSLQSFMGGPWSMDSMATINQQSFLFAYVTESNVTDYISLAKTGGINILFLEGWCDSVGHYTISPEAFPHGLDGLKAVVDQIQDSGLFVGLHTFNDCISTIDDYVTSIPNAELQKDASFTLSDVIDASATTIYVTGAIPTSLPTTWGSYGGNVLQIGDELIQYTNYVNDTQNGVYYFTGCTRGAFRTVAASHNADLAVSHLKTFAGLFLPTPGSALQHEIGTNLANILNYCEIDMICLDAADVPERAFGSTNGIYEIVSQLDHDIRIELSVAPTNYTWTFTSVTGAWDTCMWGDKKYIDYHLANGIKPYENEYLATQLGWYAIRSYNSDNSALFPDEFEYACVKAIANDIPLSILPLSAYTEANGRQNDYLTLWKQYQSLYIDEEMKERMKVYGDEFHLETLPDGTQYISQVEYNQHTIRGLNDSTITWMVNDPYVTQSPTIRIEALNSVESYNGASQQIVAGTQNDATAFNANISTADGNVSASMMWASSQSYPNAPIGETGSMLFSATNNGTEQSEAWAKVTKTFSTPLNITGKDAIGVWIYGDNNGEILNLQLVSDNGDSANDNFVTVNFDGWKYFELPFCEYDMSIYSECKWPYTPTYQRNLTRSNITGINIFSNNLPVSQTSNCYISLVKALPIHTVDIVNPQLTIAGSMLTFPITLQSGQYIEFNGMTDCKVYDKTGLFITSITPTGINPVLTEGDNMVVFNCTSPSGGYNARAKITIGTYDTETANMDASTVLSLAFEEQSGYTALDTSSYLNDGLLSATVQRVAGKTGLGEALQFNGVDSSVTISSSESLTNIVGSFSVDTWFKYSGEGTAGKDSWTLLAKNATTSTNNETFNIFVRSSDHHLCARVGNGMTSYTLDSDVVVNDGEYHYVALVYDDTSKTYRLYLDDNDSVNQSVAPNWTIARNASDVTLGFWEGNDNYFNGIIDQVQILSRPLNAAEIENRYDNHLPTISISDPTNNDTISAPTSISLVASASDTGGSISRVAFYQGNTWLCDGVSDGEGNFEAAWEVPANQWGTYTIMARAIDSSGVIVASSPVNITVTAAPSIATFPKNQTTDPGQTATFSVQATGPGTLSYQWRKWENDDWTDISGATNAYYTTPATQASDDDSLYSVVVTNSYGSVESNGVRLYVNYGLEARWKFDETTGTYAADSTGNGHTGTLYNNPTWANSLLNGGLGLDGLDSNITVAAPSGSPFEYTDNDEMTITTWVYINSSESDGGWLISKPWNGGGQYNYYLHLNANNYLTFHMEGATSYSLPVGTLSKEAWHHVAVTVNSTNTVEVYIDGTRKAYGQCTITNWTPSYGAYPLPLTIGTLYPYGTQTQYYYSSFTIDGKLDDTRFYTHALSAEAIAAQACGLVGIWKLDDANGTVASDSSGNSNIGTLYNGASWTSGQITGAVELDGINDHIVVPNTTALKYTGGEMTLSTWINIDPDENNGENDGGWLISKPWNGGGQYNYYLRLNANNQIIFYLQGTTTYSIATLKSLSKGAWHHIVATVDATKQMTIYIDGNEEASNVHTITNWTPSSGDANCPLAVGTVYPYGNGWAGNSALSFNGKMDDVRIYAQALSKLEIEQLFNMSLPEISIVLPSAASAYVKPTSVTIQVDASDKDGDIQRVEFYEDGNLIGTDTAFPYIFNWDPIAGSHDLTAVAINSAGIANVSKPVSISVQAKPEIEITGLDNNVLFVVPGESADVSLAAVASDEDGTVTAVSFYADDTWIADGTLSNGIWTANWHLDAWSYGEYALTARAADDDSFTTISTTLNLTIAGAPTNQAADVGQTATFVVASPVGASLLDSYQWQEWDGDNWGDIDGATGPYYTTAPLGQGDDGKQYRVVVSKTGGTEEISPSATLYVNYGLEMWLKLDDASGTNAADATGNGHTGTLYNSPSWDSGLLNGALTFNGTNSHVGISATGDSPFEYTGGEMTLSSWIYIDPNETNSAYLFSKPWNASGQYNYFLCLDATNKLKFSLQYAMPGTTTITSLDSLSTGTWHYVAITLNSDKLITMYIDGDTVASTTHAITNWTPSGGDIDRSLTLGAVYPYGNGWGGSTSSFKGKMDNVCFYTHALSEEAIVEQAKAPVFAWKLDESSGSAVDSTGYGYTGTLSYGPTWSPEGGEFDGAIIFDGTDSYVSTPTTSTMLPALKYIGGEMTLATWVFVDQNETDGCFISKPRNETATEYNYMLGLDDGKVVFSLQGTSTTYTLPTDDDLPTNSWHHVAATVNAAGQMTIYIDGEEVKSGTHNISTWSSSDGGKPLVIGTAYNWSSAGTHTSESFAGKMDNVYVYNQVLSDDEIRILAIDPPITVQPMENVQKHAHKMKAKLVSHVKIKNHTKQSIHVPVNSFWWNGENEDENSLLAILQTAQQDI